MKTFNGAELAFSYTYFPNKPDRIIEIPLGKHFPVALHRLQFLAPFLDAITYPLALNEEPETAGSYSIGDNGLGLEDRVIFWCVSTCSKYLHVSLIIQAH